ncbi:unnamed protein product, partial [Discosporangium mesarthrocarpum]
MPDPDPRPMSTISAIFDKRQKKKWTAPRFLEGQKQDAQKSVASAATSESSSRAINNRAAGPPTVQPLTKFLVKSRASGLRKPSTQDRSRVQEDRTKVHALKGIHKTRSGCPPAAGSQARVPRKQLRQLRLDRASSHQLPGDRESKDVLNLSRTPVKSSSREVVPETPAGTHGDRRLATLGRCRRIGVIPTTPPLSATLESPPCLESGVQEAPSRKKGDMESSCQGKGPPGDGDKRESASDSELAPVSSIAKCSKTGATPSKTGLPYVFGTRKRPCHEEDNKQPNQRRARIAPPTTFMSGKHSTPAPLLGKITTVGSICGKVDSSCAGDHRDGVGHDQCLRAQSDQVKEEKDSCIEGCGGAMNAPSHSLSLEASGNVLWAMGKRLQAERRGERNAQFSPGLQQDLYTGVPSLDGPTDARCRGERCFGAESVMATSQQSTVSHAGTSKGDETTGAAGRAASGGGGGVDTFRTFEDVEDGPMFPTHSVPEHKDKDTHAPPWADAQPSAKEDAPFTQYCIPQPSQPKSRETAPTNVEQPQTHAPDRSNTSSSSQQCAPPSPGVPQPLKIHPQLAQATTVASGGDEADDAPSALSRPKLWGDKGVPCRMSGGSSGDGGHKLSAGAGFLVGRHGKVFQSTRGGTMSR